MKTTMMSWLDKNQRLKDQALRLKPKGQLRNYLMTPLVDTNLPVKKVNYLVLDFETTGLDFLNEHIISIGFTEISNWRVQLNKSQHHLVKTTRKLISENVSIHKITDDQLDKGISIQCLMDLLLQHMAGKVLVAHYQSIEYNFIQQLSQNLFGHRLPIQIIDTFKLERKRLIRLHQPIQNNQLRLFNLREKYHLPRYHAHNAMEDAIATAELLLAQISHRQRHGYQLKLKHILS